MTKAEIFKWVVDVVILPIVIYGVSVLSSLNQTMHQLNATVSVLNAQYNSQEKRIDKLEDKVFGK
jgi:uncharacterized protein YoxC